MSKEIFTPEQIAELLAVDEQSVKKPSQEQKKIITAELGAQYLVMAGAGSGKTETLSQRVLWLVVNGYVKPTEILGLTFANKAKKELSERLQTRLALFITNASDRASGLNGEQKARVDELAKLKFAEGFNLPDVFTYDAFAGSLISEFGGNVGLRLNMNIISESQAQMLAYKMLKKIDHSLLINLGDSNTDEIIKNIVKLEETMTNNDSDEEIVSAEITKLVKLLEGLTTGANTRTAQGKRDEVVADITYTKNLLPLVAEYRAFKRKNNMFRFSDQMATAKKIFDKSEHALNTIRNRYRVVLLDEVQDTSAGQTELLSKIFSGLTVMGVGDPHQSIYSWRGASADSMSKFLEHYRGDKQLLGKQFSISTSWRNSEKVLEVANLIAAPLRKLVNVNSEMKMDVKKLKAAPNAEAGSVECEIYETSVEDVQNTAKKIKKLRDLAAAEGKEPPTIAILCRNNDPLPNYQKELQKIGVPAVVVGSGGMLATPEIMDLLSMLRILSDSDASSALIRILEGPRYRIGLGDLAELTNFARELQKADSKRIPESVVDTSKEHYERIVTNVLALDRLASLDSDSELLQDFSEEGILRLQRAAQDFRELRRYTTGSIPDLIMACVAHLRLDVELLAHPKFRDLSTGEVKIDPLSNINDFVRFVEDYLRANPAADLVEVLQWIEIAQRENDDPDKNIEVSREAVQLLTGHKAKGLEWDFVFMPEMLYFVPRETSIGELKKAKLLPQLRKDSDSDSVAVPEFKGMKRIADFINSNGSTGKYADYIASVKAEKVLERRRQLYVMITRAKKSLFLSGSFWKPGSATANMRDKKASLAYLTEIETVIGNIQNKETKLDKNPLHDSGKVVWPLNPLGSRENKIKKAGDAVAELLNKARKGSSEPLAKLSLLDEELLREHKARSAGVLDVKPHVNASSFYKLQENPKEYWRNNLRPVPEAPSRRADIGNRFHEWVERQYTTEIGKSLQISGLETREVPHRSELNYGTEHLEKMKQNFAESIWGNKQPLHLELALENPFADSSVRSRIDAIYEWEDDTEQESTIEIVDWKTGALPENTGNNIASEFLQLQIYRHVYSQQYDVALERINATLFYVAENRVYKLKDLPAAEILSFAELEAIYYDRRKQAAAE
ncbi:ATP-dependent helicase [Canibacter sp. lx-72]|uniref:ATP-dependent DNA helicase n=1 Tax=Canibacter zhuwentaonis TaxID=2837491 RepID=UPI001BDDBF08|nr:ATP-dependent DNA helicase [Canibacter zhuwentaonis]MBT1017817.1 ATP-dependent helicase [Canibacter zhuwentaonis]